MDAAVSPREELQGRLLRVALEAASGVTDAQVGRSYVPATALKLEALVVGCCAQGVTPANLKGLWALRNEVNAVVVKLNRAKAEFAHRLSVWRAEKREQLHVRIEEETKAGQIEAFLESAVRARTAQFDAYHRGPALRAMICCLGLIEEVMQERPQRSAQDITGAVVEAVATVLAMGITVGMPNGQDLQMAGIRDRIIILTEREGPPSQDLDAPGKAQEQRIQAFLEADEGGTLLHPKLTFLQAPFPEVVPDDETALAAWESLVSVGVVARIHQCLYGG